MATSCCQLFFVKPLLSLLSLVVIYRIRQRGSQQCVNPKLHCVGLSVLSAKFHTETEPSHLQKCPHPPSNDQGCQLKWNLFAYSIHISQVHILQHVRKEIIPNSKKMTLNDFNPSLMFKRKKHHQLWAKVKNCPLNLVFTLLKIPKL